MVIQASFRMSVLVSIKTFDETKIVFCSTLLVGLYNTLNLIFTNLSFESLGSGIWIAYNYDWAAVVLLGFIQIYTFSEAFLVFMFFAYHLPQSITFSDHVVVTGGGGGSEIVLPTQNTGILIGQSLIPVQWRCNNRGPVFRGDCFLSTLRCKAKR